MAVWYMICWVLEAAACMLSWGPTGNPVLFRSIGDLKGFLGVLGGASEWVSFCLLFIEDRGIG